MRPIPHTLIHAGDHALLLMLGPSINHSLLSTSLRTGARALGSPSTPTPPPPPACVIDRPAGITARKASCSSIPIDPRPEPGERARAREDGHCTSEFFPSLFIVCLFCFVSATSRRVGCKGCSLLECSSDKALQCTTAQHSLRLMVAVGPRCGFVLRFACRLSSK